jgi:hypothetical protein
MKREVLIGPAAVDYSDPALPPVMNGAVDYSDPALPPGMNAEKIHYHRKGLASEVCFIKPDETAVPTIERCLTHSVYDCVVIGADVRLPPNRLGVFEAVVNALHRAAPHSAISFHTQSEDSGTAAARWM